MQQKKSTADVFVMLDPETFGEILNGKTKVSTQNKDHFYRVGDVVSLIESNGSKKFDRCPEYDNDCTALLEAMSNSEYRFNIEGDALVPAGDSEIERQESAIEICCRDRALCSKYRVIDLTGRECKVKVTEILIQNTIFVRFAFEILTKKETVNPYKIVFENGVRR